jgi:hypothetical protein
MPIGILSATPSQGKEKQFLTEPRTNAARHDTLRKVHSVGYCEYD